MYFNSFVSNDMTMTREKNRIYSIGFRKIILRFFNKVNKRYVSAECFVEVRILLETARWRV